MSINVTKNQLEKALCKAKSIADACEMVGLSRSSDNSFKKKCNKFGLDWSIVKKKAKDKILKYCENCNKKFYVIDNRFGYNQRFCSHSCSNTAVKRRSRALPVNARCLFCDEKFYYYPKRKSSKYCSKECSRSHIKYQAIEKIKAALDSGYSIDYYQLRHAKKILLEECSNKCQICGISNIWNGKPLTLQLDHIDGNHLNNTKKNLRIICPNCHTQTATYGSKNKNKPENSPYRNWTQK